MRKLVHQGVDILRKEGAWELLTKSKRYFGTNRLTAKYWQLRGGYPVTVSDTTARFQVENSTELFAIVGTLGSERPVLNDMAEEIEPDDVLWDVGANLGLYSCTLGQKATEVVAFEPYPPNVEVLVRNLEHNDIPAEVLELALADSAGTAQLTVPERTRSGDVWPALLPEGRDPGELKNSETVTTRVESGDVLVRSERVSGPDVVKIDVEGGAPLVIEGMAETLSDTACRLCYVEVHLPDQFEDRPSTKDFGWEAEEVQQKLERLGYDTRVIHRRHSDYFVKAVAR